MLSLKRTMEDLCPSPEFDLRKRTKPALINNTSPVKPTRLISATSRPSIMDFATNLPSSASSHAHLLSLKHQLETRHQEQETRQAEIDNATQELRKFRSHLFTREQVDQEIKAAIQKREAELKEEFQAELQRQLDEQFQQYSTFAKDYLSRQVESHECSYIY
eukprot:TRINITY_DN1520_c0_g1_i1.p1 TRINITY_DN1520_c0_g1~~TRINITY_DN1520_c0_g1_i1.p1  ORF type:complete len:162 (-),score=36.99 TRINITY_DN1520_c0_g1_i1:59-544(-)